MHSRVRAALEAALRAIALIALGVLILYAFRALRSAPTINTAGARVDSALVQWSTRDVPGRVHVELDTPPSAETRDWLAALAGAGTAVTWGGSAPAPSALAVEPVADPRRATRVWLAAPTGARFTLHDGLGIVDSASVMRSGARVVIPQLVGTLRAAAADFEATSAVRDSLVLRPVLVLGQAGWEAKFIIAALEEHGWKTETRLAVAPTGDVRQGAESVVIDTARYAAVIAIDSVATRYSTQIIRYVRAGGGLIALGEGARLAALQSVMPAAVSAPPSMPSAFTAEVARTSPRAPLALAPLGRLEPGSVVLETRRVPAGNNEETAAAAWRVDHGRVLQIGYYDTWRWRLAGGDADPVRAHRDWWAALVSSIAYAPRVPLAVEEMLEPTPLATLVATLGPPHSQPPLRASIFDDPRLPTVLISILLAALLFEWASRRLRGRR